MITARKALIGETEITVYSGNRSDAMPTGVTAGDRFINKDDHINYIYGADGWKEEVEESELPILYNFDNGKVLTAQSGTWVKKTPTVKPDELPTVPTVSGSYILKCTVSETGAVLSWEAETAEE